MNIVLSLYGCKLLGMNISRLLMSLDLKTSIKTKPIMVYFGLNPTNFNMSLGGLLIY